MYAIWLPVLAGDSRSAWNEHLLDDPRVISLWDESQLAGKWFADHSLGGLGGAGGLVWDAYLAFGSTSRWQNEPNAVLAAGSPIIDNVDRLDQHFIPLLR